MRRSRPLILLAAALAALCLTTPARADEPAAPPGAPAAVQPAAPVAPAAPQTPAPAPVKTTARKEEDEEAAKAGLFARLRAYTKGTNALADQIATLQAENADLQARLTEFENGTTLKALQDENAAMKADITAFMAYAQTHGLIPETGAKPGTTANTAPQSPAGIAAGHAIAAAVTTQLQALGIPLATLPPAAAPAAATTTEDLQALSDQLAAATDPAERGRLAKKLIDLRAKLETAAAA